MGSLNKALDGCIAKPNDINDMIAFINGQKAGPWWGTAFRDIQKIIAHPLYDDLWGKGEPRPTHQEVAAVYMMFAHIRWDLFYAMKLEGVGTDADYAAIGKIVRESAEKISPRPKLMQRIGALVMPEFDPMKLREDMRAEVKKWYEQNILFWKVDPEASPYTGLRTELLEWYEQQR